MKKNWREYKWDFEAEILPCVALAIGLENDQPKKNYKTANWELTILVLCFGFKIKLSYRYEPLN